MEMEVMIPVNSMDFDFSSPLVSPPSTPKRIGEFYCSAPTSPTHMTQFYRDFDDFLSSGGGGGASSEVPSARETNPNSPKNGDDFAFDIGEESSETASISADELFDGGVIKPLKPPPLLQHPPGAKIKGDFSQRREKAAVPFAIAAAPTAVEHRRGRERAPAVGLSSSSNSSRRATRSLSPLRGSDQIPWDQEEKKQQNTKNFASKSQRKWSLKDFFLFRSASEGRAADKDPLRKYTAGFRRSYEDAKKSTFQDSGLNSRRRGKVSAHELHYTANRAVSEDLKKKTFLPYKQGILGRLSFNPTPHALAGGFSRK